MRKKCVRKSVLIAQGKAISADGRVMHVGDRVLWRDPETGESTEYVVYDVHSADLVRLSNDYSECEALPGECTIVSRKPSKNREDKVCN